MQTQITSEWLFVLLINIYTGKNYVIVKQYFENIC